MPSRSNFIDGEWIDAESGDTFDTHDPANPDAVVGTYAQSGAVDAERAIEAALVASDEWADTPGPQRGRILSRASRVLAERKEELTELLVREEGKTQPEAAGEVQRAIDIFDYYGAKARDVGGTVKGASGPDTTLRTKTEPLGVAGLITPWNYPIAIPTWKIAPALAAGNAAVIKPATLAPGCTYEIAEALAEAGLPEGVLNVVTGPGGEVGDTIASHPDVDAVSFTGSTGVGNAVYDTATEDGKRVQLEMGGKNPIVVSDTADVAEAASIVAGGAFGVTGQACTATSRAIVYEDVYDEFVDAVVAEAEGIEPGNGLEGGEMGPQVSASELEGTLDYVTVGKQEGATLETGGDALDRDGHFVEPTVFADVDADSRIAQEEIFGPVLSVIPVGGYHEALAVANGVEYGLSAGIVTDDHTEANRFVDDIEAGVVKVNEKTTGVELHVPFGGMKASSSETYREQGEAGIDFYSITKTVYDNY
ncbi:MULTISPECIES: 2,5-dioxovalerate dehydrogenase [Halolamina]|uniref:Aldehyde dehydrogenase (NAD+) n=1 Tax=Halolamina pelagica TaxID=699431 RepID=A0A1I5N3H8_9EURY|nr:MULTISPECIES: aldehyde dehydrogenase family protein [Halolamina]NHX36280.1 aldehyde dehydrogenase family protein [Halolamina sp. R1-12]SFP16142.1 aldehyde dehydrogenase (NAD+) [Halolamina pelagica]